MYPPSPYAKPMGSFNVPVTPPGQDPTTGPFLSVQVPCAWLPFIRGALKQLLLQSTWHVSDVTQLQIAQQRAFGIIDLFQECSGSGVAWACPFDFHSIFTGWVVPTDSNLSPNFRGVWNPPNGIETTLTHVISANEEITSLQVSYFLPTAAAISTVVMQYNLLKGFFVTTGAQNGIIGLLGGAVQFTQLVASHTDPDGTGKILTASPAGITCDEIRLYITCGADNGFSNPGGGAIVTYCEIDGTGVQPC